MGNEVTTLLNRPLPEGWFQQSGPHSFLCHPKILWPNLPPLPVPVTLNNLRIYTNVGDKFEQFLLQSVWHHVKYCHNERRATNGA